VGLSFPPRQRQPREPSTGERARFAGLVYLGSTGVGAALLVVALLQFPQGAAFRSALPSLEALTRTIPTQEIASLGPSPPLDDSVVGTPEPLALADVADPSPQSTDVATDASLEAPAAGPSAEPPLLVLAQEPVAPRAPGAFGSGNVVVVEEQAPTEPAISEAPILAMAPIQEPQADVIAAADGVGESDLAVQEAAPDRLAPLMVLLATLGSPGEEPDIAIARPLRLPDTLERRAPAPVWSLLGVPPLLASPPAGAQLALPAPVAARPGAEPAPGAAVSAPESVARVAPIMRSFAPTTLAASGRGIIDHTPVTSVTPSGSLALGSIGLLGGQLGRAALSPVEPATVGQPPLGPTSAAPPTAARIGGGTTAGRATSTAGATAEASAPTRLSEAATTAHQPSAPVRGSVVATHLGTPASPPTVRQPTSGATGGSPGGGTRSFAPPPTAPASRPASR
jgi:hypothetical protein